MQVILKGSRVVCEQCEGPAYRCESGDCQEYVCAHCDEGKTYSNAFKEIEIAACNAHVPEYFQ